MDDLSHLKRLPNEAELADMAMRDSDHPQSRTGTYAMAKELIRLRKLVHDQQKVAKTVEMLRKMAPHFQSYEECHEHGCINGFDHEIRKEADEILKQWK